MAQTTEIPAFYNATRRLADWYFSTFYDYSVSGLENVPLNGSLIFAANHVSFYDPPAIGAKVQRHINYFARDTLFRGLFGRALYKLEAIPVAREQADVASLKAIFRTLKNEGAIAIYPEGTRSEDGLLGEPKPGAGMIACKSRATVVPTRLFGTYEIFGRQQKLPKVGGPIHHIPSVIWKPPVASWRKSPSYAAHTAISFKKPLNNLKITHLPESDST